MNKLITPEDVRRLAAFDARPGVTVSVYLNVDGRQYPRRNEYELHLDGLLREGRAKGAPEADLSRISDYVRSGIDRSETRSVAMFSCAEKGFWEAFHLPRPLRHRVAVNDSPAIRPLEFLLDDYDRFGVVLVDRARARMFRFYLGVIEERNEWVDDVMGQHEQGGWSQARFQRHVEDEVHKHLKRTAEQALRMFEAQPFDRLLVGGPEEVVADFEKMLHSYLSERLAGRISVSLADPVETVRQAALAAEERLEREAEAGAVERLREVIGRNGAGAAGLGPVLEALGQRRVETLLVSRGFEHPGWKCPSCGLLSSEGPSCPACRSEMDEVEDVVEEAIEEGVTQSARIEMVAENADLDALGRIGAILRY